MFEDCDLSDPCQKTANTCNWLGKLARMSMHGLVFDPIGGSISRLIEPVGSLQQRKRFVFAFGIWYSYNIDHCPLQRPRAVVNFIIYGWHFLNINFNKAEYINFTREPKPK